MRKYVLLPAIIALFAGAAGGGAAVYFWLARHPVAEHFPGDGADADHARSEGAKTAHAHEGHAEEAGHDEHGAGKVKLSAEAIREFGVVVAVAAGGKLEQTLKLPGEVVLNADTVAHMVPRVTGVVREVRKNVGDRVVAGEVLAVLESRELAEAKAADLSAEARLRLAENSYKRIEGLLQKKIVPEQEFYEARQKLEEVQIQHRETEAKLRALGLKHDELTAISAAKDADLSRYEIKAPFAATIVEKHAAQGEVHDSSSDMFVLADLSTVWVDITVYPQDGSRVRSGCRVHLSLVGRDGQPARVDAAISYVSPVIREATRTGTARAVIPNPGGVWKPGSFVTAEIVLGEDDVSLLVPNTALQVIDSESVLFVEEGDAFEKRVARLGRNNDTYSEVLSGMKPGDRYVVKGGFILKAELEKGSGEHEH